ncbi:MAG: BamA/TamA family outer membrane protein, partial [Bacteroidota bacterium]|nr:BamA/TamA family outer membrane protein [Bacteroidota bacterium]
LRQTIDLVDLSYVYMPRVDSTFKATYLTNNSYLKYSYEDHFILRMGYSFSYSSIAPGVNNKTYYTMRGSVESAGNALSAIYTLAGAEKENGFYKIGNISFAQYLKGEFEYAKSVVLSSRNKLAYRAGFGVACPYGNSQILPFEKRFFSGGANSVRGWSVRTLGPGSYKSTSGSIDFMNQSGDVKLDLGAEYRSRLFWKFESALFADAGNIWTIRNYPDQPGGQFHPSTFYKQIASSVGVGLRLDFSYFLARLDLGMKVFDPSLTGADRWRILSIDNPDDFAIHLAIGYPF